MKTYFENEGLRTCTVSGAYLCAGLHVGCGQGILQRGFLRWHISISLLKLLELWRFTLVDGPVP